ncbi:MAG: M23 family metallopeptidase [Nitrospinaceae bacterium]
MTFQKLLLKTISLLLIVLFFTGCQAFKRVMMGSGQGIYHTVQEGQTLYRIAQVYEVDVSRLQRINRIRDTSKLQVGTRLWIPGAYRVLTVPPTDEPARKKKTRMAKKGKRRPTVAPLKGFLIWPVKGTLTSRFGNRRGRHHDGIDIGAPKGRAIVAAAAGEVMFSGWGPTGYGKMVILKHKHRLTTLYAHASKFWVKKGNRVKKGQKIGAVGSTGRSSGPHLHFEVRNETHPQNPLKYLPKR